MLKMKPDNALQEMTTSLPRSKLQPAPRRWCNPLDLRLGPSRNQSAGARPKRFPVFLLLNVPRCRYPSLPSGMTPASFHVRSLYRSLLRELPHRPLSTPSPLQQRLRTTFRTEPRESPAQQVEFGEQYVQYAKAQRMYATLLERYNPGMSMDEEEKVRLTARRVGMDLPEEWRPGQKA